LKYPNADIAPVPGVSSNSLQDTETMTVEEVNIGEVHVLAVELEEDNHVVSSNMEEIDSLGEHSEVELVENLRKANKSQAPTQYSIARGI